MIQSPDFHDRADAGRRLAAALLRFQSHPDVLVLALPRGGVPVAFEVASALKAPLDVLIVRKLGAPGHPELAIGAIASGGIRVLNQDLVRSMRLSASEIESVTAAETVELARRERAFREGAFPDVSGKIVILIDDGIATGATLRAAIQALRSRSPARLVVAVPVAPAETCREIDRLADELVCLETPAHFRAVGLAYEEFEQVSDPEVRDLLARSRQHAPLRSPPGTQNVVKGLIL